MELQEANVAAEEAVVGQQRTVPEVHVDLLVKEAETERRGLADVVDSAQVVAAERLVAPRRQDERTIRQVPRGERNGDVRVG